MNKWSTSLPSIISLCNDVQFNFNPMVMEQTNTTGSFPNSGGSLTDLSIMIQTQSPFINYDQYPINYSQKTSFYDTSIEHETTIQTNIPSHEQFVPNDQLLQSLVAYADSFDLDTSIYSIQNTKPQPAAVTPMSTRQTSLRRRTQSSTTHLTSVIENDPLIRHKSCEDLSILSSVTSSSKPATVIRREEHLPKRNETKFIPSESHPQFFFATKTNRDDPNDHHTFEEKPTEDNTTTGGSKVEWGFSSNTMNELNKPASDLFSNYEATVNIGDINLHYLKDLEQFSSMAASMDFSTEIATPIPPPPIVIRKQSKDFRLRQQVDIQLLRPPTPPPPAPIIIREVRRKPPSTNGPFTIHQKLENTGQIHLSKTPSPIILRERPPLPPRHQFSSQPTIVYHHLPTPPPSPPIVVVERLRPYVSTIIRKPAPILVEKWLPYPPEQKRKVIYERASPLPIRNKRHANDQNKRIIVEYDKVNVIVDKDIKQRKEIRRVHPGQYVQQYGNSLYSNESLNHIITNVTCSSQINNEQPIRSHQHHYENYTPVFH